MSPAQLSQLEPRAVSLLKADDYFTDITVIEISDGDITTKINMRLAAGGISKDNPEEKIGAAVIIGNLTGDIDPSQPRKVRLTPRLVAGVLVSPQLNISDNGTQKAALAIVENIIRVLHRAPINEGVSVDSATYRFICPSSNTYTILTPEVKLALYGVEGGIGYHVNFDATIIVTSSNQ